MSLACRFVTITGVLYAVIVLSTLMQNLNTEIFEVIPFSKENIFQKFMESQTLRGNWTNALSSPLLDHKRGATQVYFTRYINISHYSVQTNLLPQQLFVSPPAVVVIWLHDNYFRDDRLLKITKVISFEVQNNTIAFHEDASPESDMITHEDSQFTRTINCPVTGNITLNPAVYSPEGINTTNFKALDQVIAIDIRAGGECQLELHIDLEASPITSTIKCILYSIFLVTIVMTNWFGAIRIINKIF